MLEQSVFASASYAEVSCYELCFGRKISQQTLEIAKKSLIVSD